MAKRTSDASSFAIKVHNPQINYFDKSHYLDGSCNFGPMYPVFWEPTLPGSHHKISCEHLVRALPMVAPALSDVYVEFRSFYVRNDVLWRGWRSFIKGGGEGITPPPFPQFYVNPSDVPAASVFGPKSLSHWLGCKTEGVDPDGGDSPQLSALPFMAYQKIWFEYFRDQNNDAVAGLNAPDYYGEERYCADGLVKLTTPGGGPYDWNFANLRSVCWRNDYFMSTLPRAQRGDAVAIPSPGSIDDLTKATRLQRMAQLSNRIGNRYREFLRGEYGVIPSDDSLDIPQFLGGHTSRLTIGEVLQTSSTDATSPLAEMGGRGITIEHSRPVSFHADHHGIIMTIMFLRPGNMYYNPCRRELLKTSRYDFGLPDLAQIGDQITDRREINANMLWQSGGSIGGEPLGYQAPYEEYKQFYSSVAGELATSALDHWHLARKYGDRSSDSTMYPDYLSPEFTRIAGNSADLDADSQLYRIFADTSLRSDHFVFELYIHHSAGQPLPAYSDPSFDFFR